MAELEQTKDREAELLKEIESLRQEVVQLRQQNDDLENSLLMTTEHGDFVEAELQQVNQQLQAEVSERKMAQAALQEILETVSQHKADLEVMLQTTAEHGDALEYELYTQAVETMRQSEELFRAISESTPTLMILTQELDGVIKYANSISAQRLGLGIEQLIGCRLQEFFVNPDDELFLQERLEQEGSTRNFEMQVKRTDGSMMWVSASMHRLILGDQPTLLTTLYDISDRKAAEVALMESKERVEQQAQELELRVEQRTRELQQAEEKYRSIFENASEGIFQVSTQGRFISANPALAALYGYGSAEELMAAISDIDTQIYVQPRRRDELVAYLRQFDSIESCESKVYRKDGSVIWVSENIRVVRDRTGSVLFYEGSVWDITDRKAAEDELRQQRLTSERLLLNVLPQIIAERLKRGEKTIADSFADATVLFADIVNFTGLSATISPVELVGLLNRVFSAFDRLTDRYGLEKIKTIGDAYMVVGGMPTQMPRHVEAIADMALGMLEAVDRLKTREGETIVLRIGIHSGPVVGGVIGTRKFSYDLWGDTVNVASRMETQGEPGRIQVTEVVYERLKNQFLFQPRAPIEVKGKGLMNTYWLLSRANSPHPAGYREG